MTTAEHLHEWLPYIEIAMHAEARRDHHRANGGK